MWEPGRGGVRHGGAPGQVLLDGSEATGRNARARNIERPARVGDADGDGIGEGDPAEQRLELVIAGRLASEYAKEEVELLTSQSGHDTALSDSRDEDRWTVRWEARGPAKDYRLDSVLTRPGS